MKRTGGNWHPDASAIYFCAANLGSIRLAEDLHPYVLVAVNELPPADTSDLDRLLKKKACVFIDSGVYSLAAETARVRGITHDVALRLPLEELRGFHELFEKYVSVAKAYGDRVWGIVEVDLGGRDQKRKTRTKLEAMGLRPIPVYHPLNDGWDYLDELLGQYDRICIGNIVNASRYVRKRIIATIWERKMRRNPSCWIHLLGLTMNEWLMAYPINSCDSSSWLSCVRWGGYIEKTSQRSVGHLPKNFQYKPGDMATHQKGVRMAAVGCAMQVRNYRAWEMDAGEGAGILPDLVAASNRARAIEAMNSVAIRRWHPPADRESA